MGCEQRLTFIVLHGRAFPFAYALCHTPSVNRGIAKDKDEGSAVMKPPIREPQRTVVTRAATPGDAEAPLDGGLLQRFWRRLLVSVIFGVMVLFALAIASDAHALLNALQQFHWQLLPFVILLTLWNYLFRFGKWQLYLRWLDLQTPSQWTSWLIFLSGLAMSLTPGKVGEFLKAAFIRRFTGAPAARALPIVIAERLTDGIAMLLLALVSASLDLHASPALFLVLLGIVIVGILVILQRPLMERLLSLSERIPILKNQATALMHAYHAAYVLFLPHRLIVAVGIGLISWMGECIALGLILTGLGAPFTRDTFSLATFALSSASIAGAISLLPGGIGVAEAGIVGLLFVFGHSGLTTQQASAATVLIRCSTLWFGVLLGLLALLALLQSPVPNSTRSRVG